MRATMQPHVFSPDKTTPSSVYQHSPHCNVHGQQLRHFPQQLHPPSTFATNPVHGLPPYSYSYSTPNPHCHYERGAPTAQHVQRPLCTACLPPPPPPPPPRTLHHQPPTIVPSADLSTTLGARCSSVISPPLSYCCGPPPAAAAPHRYKTQLCKNFVAHGRCPYHQRCQFAHGAMELRSYVGRGLGAPTATGSGAGVRLDNHRSPDLEGGHHPPVPSPSTTAVPPYTASCYGLYAFGCGIQQRNDARTACSQRAADGPLPKADGVSP